MMRLTCVVLLLAIGLAGCAGSGGGLGFPQCAPDQGTVEAPKVSAGDVWAYREIDDYTKVERGVFRLEATAVDAEGIAARLTLPGGATVTETYDPTWAWKTASNRGWDWLARLAPGSGTVTFSPPFDSTPFPLRVGQSWTSRVVAIHPATRAQIPIDIRGSARCWEKIRVPAGEFVALRIERAAYLQDTEWYRSQTTLRQVDWYVPALNRSVMTWHDSYYYDYRQQLCCALIRGDRLRWELTR
jgi:hypothetical protein